MNSIFKTKGINGILELYDDKIIIKPSGMLSMGIVERILSFSSISRMDFKEAGLTSGYIRFIESSNSASSISVWNAAKDINTFMYAQKRQNKAILRIKDYVDIHLGDKDDHDYLLFSQRKESIVAELKSMRVGGSSTRPNTIINSSIENPQPQPLSQVETGKPEQIPSNKLAPEVDVSPINSINILSVKTIYKILIFVGWSLSAFSFVVALAGLTTPGAGKILSVTFLGWGLIFLPLLWRKTIKYGLPVNVIARVISFTLLPVFAMSLAMANGYQPITASKVPQINQSSKTPSPSPQTQVKKVLVAKPSANNSDSSIQKTSEKSPTEKNNEAFTSDVSTTKSAQSMGQTFQKSSKYSFQQPSLFQSGSAEKALAEYMLAWREKDWERMAKYTQVNWRTNNPGEELSDYHKYKILKGFEIVSTNVVGNVVHDVTYNIWYEYMTDEITTKQVTARIIKEDKEANPNAYYGEWGVNPISTLRENDR